MSRKLNYFLLFGILVLGFLLRLYGVAFGLPELYHADEPIVVNHAVSFGLGDLNPHFFKIPPLMSYLLFFIYGIYFLIGLFCKSFPSIDYFQTLFITDPSSFYLIGRMCVGVIVGTLSILLVYKLSRDVFSRAVGLFAALFYSIAFLPVQHSHYIYTDTFLVFGILLSAIVSLKLFKKYECGGCYYIYSGMCAGLTTAIKYNGALVFLFIIVVHLLTQGFRRFYRVLISGFVMCAIFIFLNPFALFDFSHFFHEVFSQAGAEGGQGWLYHIRYSLFEGLGPVLTVLGVIGMVWALIEKNKKTIPIAVFCSVFYVVLVFFSQSHERYVLALIPFLCVYAGFLIWRLFAKKKVGLLLITFVICIAPLLKSVYSDMLFARKDTRTIAKEWIESNIPAGSRISLDHTFFCPRLMQTPKQLKEKHLFTNDLRKHKKIDMLLSVVEPSKSFELYYLKRDKDLGTGFLFEQPQIPFDVSALEDNQIEYVVIHYAKESEQLPKMKDFYEDLKSNATLIKRFSPYFDKSRLFSVDKVVQTAGPVLTTELMSRERNGYTIEVYRIDGVK